MLNISQSNVTQPRIDNMKQCVKKPTIGIVGDGQLALMLAEALNKIGTPFFCLSKSEHSPMHSAFPDSITGDENFFRSECSVFSLENKVSTDQIISTENDKDHLLAVLKGLWSPSVKKLLVTHADGFCYIVGLKAGEEYYIHDILNPQELLKTA